MRTRSGFSSLPTWVLSGWPSNTGCPSYQCTVLVRTSSSGQPNGLSPSISSFMRTSRSATFSSLAFLESQCLLCFPIPS
ncbi:unnamed protein product [Durusdinium trenchii]|uniref:Secreted protein n=2 Tax=Durusdinium trenchii TaxID=1381693 RepID=A0ABP0LMH4_9DINO